VTIDDIILLACWSSASGVAAVVHHGRAEASLAARAGGGFDFYQCDFKASAPSLSMWRTLVRLAKPDPEGEDDYDRLLMFDPEGEDYDH
jgi:hypothetical protein